LKQKKAGTVDKIHIGSVEFKAGRKGMKEIKEVKKGNWCSG